VRLRSRLKSGSGGLPDLFDSEAKTLPRQDSYNRTFRLSERHPGLFARAASLQKMHCAFHP
jgi:hypothetical protein